MLKKHILFLATKEQRCRVAKSLKMRIKILCALAASGIKKAPKLEPSLF